MLSSLLSRLHLTPESSTSSPPLSDSPNADISEESPSSPVAKDSYSQMQDLFENDHGETEIPSSEQIIEELENHGNGMEREEGGITSTGDAVEVEETISRDVGGVEQADSEEGGKGELGSEVQLVGDDSQKDREEGESAETVEKKFEDVEEEVVAEFG